MASHSRFHALVAILALTFSTSPALGKALEDRNWIEVRTANFTIRSLLSEKETISLARRLEMFRAAVAVVTQMNIKAAPIPTEIYALRRGREFKHFGVDKNRAGVFTAGLRGNTILLRDAGSIEETASILHEYVHFLVGNHGGQSYPKWYNEGVAEYLSAIRARREMFYIGLVGQQQRHGLRSVSWIPIRKIITAEKYYDSWTPESKAAFHVQAWALVHYLMNTPEQKNSLSEDMARYFEIVKSGKNTIDAFEEAFGVTARQLNRELRRYVSDGEYKFATLDGDALIPTFKASVVKLTKAQVSLGLGRVALERGELDRAEHWFTLATEEQLTRPRAAAGLGDVLKFRGDFAAAQPYFEQAISLTPSDPYVQLDLAEYWHYRAMNTKQVADRKNFLESARAQYVKAWKLDDSAPETYAMYGQTYLMQGNYGRGIEMLEEARSLLPSNVNVRLILAEAYAGAGHNQQAIDAARSITSWSHDPAVAKRAQEILAQLNTKKQ